MIVMGWQMGLTMLDGVSFTWKRSFICVKGQNASYSLQEPPVLIVIIEPAGLNPVHYLWRPGENWLYLEIDFCWYPASASLKKIFRRKDKATTANLLLCCTKLCINLHLIFAPDYPMFLWDMLKHHLEYQNHLSHWYYWCTIALIQLVTKPIELGEVFWTQILQCSYIILALLNIHYLFNAAMQCCPNAVTMLLMFFNHNCGIASGISKLTVRLNPVLMWVPDSIISIAVASHIARMPSFLNNTRSLFTSLHQKT